MSSERAILNLEAELVKEDPLVNSYQEQWAVQVSVNGNPFYRFSVSDHAAYQVQYRHGSVSDLVAQHFFERLKQPEAA